MLASIVLSNPGGVFVRTVEDSVGEEASFGSRDGGVRDVCMELSRVVGVGGVSCAVLSLMLN